MDKTGMLAGSVYGLMQVADRTFHLRVGLNADQYAAEVRGQLAKLK